MNGQPFHNQYKYQFGKAAALGLLLSCLFGVVACSDEEVPDPQLYTADGVPYSYVSVGFSMAMNPVTKANPNGGEKGDDSEKGQSYENAVKNIHLFFYNVKDPTKDGKDGVNMPGDTAIVAHKYLTADDFVYSEAITQATTHAIPVENLLVGHSYHVLAVVNGGENFSDATATTLDPLQRATVTSLYTKGTDGSYSNFLMASERDELTPLTITSTNSETTPATTTIYVERVTARVDYRLADDFSDEIKNSADEVIATAEITGAMLVNTLNSNATSYLLKRVTKENADFNNTDVIFLGEEELDGTGTASNYVIDPYAGKTKSESDFESATYFPSINYGNAATWEGLFITGTSITGDDGKAWNRIGYPKENVNQNGSKAHSLGVVFRARVRLGTDENADADADAGYPTFFEWEGRYYESLEAVMEDFDEHAWTEVIINKDWSTITTWGAFKSMILNNLKDGDPFGYKAYLAGKWENKADDAVFDNKKELAWSSYMKTTFHYENQEGTVKVDLGAEADGTTRQLLSEKGVHTFKNGICYYTYWVKHANDGDDTNDMLTGKGGGVMEYATVRNNIYKLSIAGLGRIGDDVPGDAQPMINFSVLRWEPMGDEEIELQ